MEAAVAGGTRLQDTAPPYPAGHRPPLIVQATYVAASAILIEAALSFLGAGTPPEIPTWGNMIASSRVYLGLRALDHFLARASHWPWSCWR